MAIRYATPATTVARQVPGAGTNKYVPFASKTRAMVGDLFPSY